MVEHLTANQEIPEIPQGIHFLPHNYWKQLRVEHQEHSIILHEIREDLKAMKEEQPRQGRDIEELKDITKVDSFLVLTFSVFFVLYVMCLSMFVSSLHDH